MPALGLNPYGRNPPTMSIIGLVAAATVYLVGAALLASATRWMRDDVFPARRPMLALVGGVAVAWSAVMAVRGFWISIAMLLVLVVAILAPMAVGLRQRT